MGWVADLLGGLASVGGLSGLAAVLVAVRGMRARDAAVQSVQEQMVPNHGSSMRDAIDRVERSQEAMAERITALDHRLGHEMGEIRRDVAGVREDLRAARTDHEARLARLEERV